MSLNSCLFAVRLADPRGRDRLARRVEALERFYAPLGATARTETYLEPLKLLVGCIDFGGRRHGPAPWIWGGPLPARLSAGAALVGASDQQLREADGLLVAVATTDGAARMISGASGIASLHRASAEGVEAFATHAVAAAWLATGRVSIDSERIPELIAREFVGGDRTLVAGASSMAPATRIDFTTGGSRVGTYWPASQRWRLVDERAAFEHTSGALIEALERRVPEQGAFLGLTAGLDSRVLAIALHRLRRLAGTFTWGEPEWDDVVRAASIATELEVAHHRQPPADRDDDRALRMIDADVRWTEGLAAVGFTAPTWPPEMPAVVYGTGGEIGRAFYYGREHAELIRAPSRRQLERAFDARGRIAGAKSEAIELLRESEREWIADAHALGARGWRCLDVVYAEQRVRKWGRGLLPRATVVTVPGFATPEVARGLVSFPLADRVRDGFHRQFLSAFPAVSPAEQPFAATGSRARRWVTRLPAVRDIVIARRVRRRPPSAGRWIFADEWRSRPRLRSWLAEEALGSSLIEEALGADWAREIRTRFLNDEASATGIALLAAAPVALERSLRHLRIDPSER